MKFMNIDYFIRKQELLLSKLDLNYIRTKYFNILNSDDRLIALIGSRGIGKTTVIFQLEISQHSSTRFTNYLPLFQPSNKHAEL